MSRPSLNKYFSVSWGRDRAARIIYWGIKTWPFARVFVAPQLKFLNKLVVKLTLFLISLYFLVMQIHLSYFTLFVFWIMCKYSKELWHMSFDLEVEWNCKLDSLPTFWLFPRICCFKSTFHMRDRRTLREPHSPLTPASRGKKTHNASVLVASRADRQINSPCVFSRDSLVAPQHILLIASRPHKEGR